MPNIYVPNLNPFRKKIYGWLPDPQTLELPEGVVNWLSRDKDVNELLAVVPVKSNADVDLRVYCTDSHQGSLSSCVGNAIADSVEIVSAIAGSGHTELSRLFVYAMARILNGTLNQDKGTHIRSGFETLTKFGICAESAWPHLPRNVFTSPSLQAQQQARGHRIHSYYRIKSTGTQRVADAVAALRAHKPVVFGTLINKDFHGIRTMDPVGVPKSPHIGGHAMVLVGYVKGNFIVKNSWGPGWGVDGYWTMTSDYFAWASTWDMWVPTLGTEFR